MRKFLCFFFLVISQYANAQQNYFGIQGSPRKGMLSAVMNPADLNNLSHTVEIHFFSSQISLSNNTLSFGDFINAEDAYFLEAFRNSNQPFNGRTVTSILGPSVGINLGKFAFGLSTEFKASAHFINVDPSLGKYLIDNSFESTFSSTSLNTTSNQRANQANWMEIGFMGAYTLLESNRQKLSIGGNLKLLRPGSYTNISVDQFVGSVIQEGSEVILTGARSDIELSYNENIIGTEIFNFKLNTDLFGNPSSLGFDLGLSYQLKNKNHRSLLNSGITVRNLGNINYGNGQITRTYGMNIPEGTSFDLRDLSSNLQEVESLFLQSALFTNTSEKTINTLSMPTVIALNSDFTLIKKFQISLYGQKALGDTQNNAQVPIQEFYSLTPRLILGNFEVYSPWTVFDFAGLTGGFGLRYGGFFIGSYSALTSLTFDTKQADLHLGFSWGFGDGLL
ncbi:hypothetical protein [Mongoliibacter ruber]|uniref:DUF5723 domain-containing protein n=1 Tax=Mongoliibacter ruber TaxID=1750599 RepID=A0A2T0WKH9_9BACT|nr:hypothetical protein [Mongoliibacter ruber]PRY87197.1 hypothetical protein CLW00_107267 [Mongoliibacter ruber]